MKRIRWILFGLVGAVTLLATATSLAQEEQPTEEMEPAAAEAEAEASEVDLAGPRYLNLRYDEDFRYLDGPPDTYEQDFFDPVKNIALAEDWRLTLGGEFRFRMEAETNKAFGATEPAQDTFTIYRYMLHSDLKYRNLFRVFAQGVATFDEDRDLARRGLDENRWDVHQLFFDVRVLGEDLPLKLRVGRQELQYGNQRYVSPLDWANARRRFDAVKLFAHGDTWDVDLWYAKPVVVQRKQRDRFNEDYDFYGAYATYKAIPRHGVDAYFFYADKTADRLNPNRRFGDESRYTLGSRFWGETAGFDYEAELAGQWGHWAGDNIHAWSWMVGGGYTLSDVTCAPRIGAAFDWASGDKNPRDGEVGTFDQLFPLGHAWFGYLDLFGRQNINAFNVNLSAWAIPEKIKTALAFHTFWLNAKKDAIYNPSGAAGRRDRTGNSGREIGHELDLTLLWKLDVHSTVLLGYSHLWDRGFLQSTGPSENADLLYVQYGFKF